MMSDFINNSTGDDLDVEVEADYDQGVFLSVRVVTSNEREIVDAISTDHSAIEYFFERVERAKNDYYRLKAEANDAR